MRFRKFYCTLKMYVKNQMLNSMVEIRAIIHYLWLKGNDNKSIHQEVIDTYGPKAITLRTVQKRTKEFKEGRNTLNDLPRSGRPQKLDLIPIIQNYLLHNPYASTRKIAKDIGANKNTVKKVLIKHLSMKKVNFKWVPYALTEQMKAKRVEIASILLEFLTNASERKLAKIFTQDETWIYFKNGRDSMWIEAGAQIPTKPRQTIGSKKAMISVIWGINGIKSITMLPQGSKFNKKFFSNCVLEDLNKKIQTKGTYLHMDNAKPHNVPEKLRELKIKRLDHPPYSPDIAPSDFFLFGYLKKLLEGMEFSNENELFDKVQEILTSIPKSIFKNAYDEWMNRLFAVIERHGEYIH